MTDLEFGYLLLTNNVKARDPVGSKKALRIRFGQMIEFVIHDPVFLFRQPSPDGLPSYEEAVRMGRGRDGGGRY